MKMVKEYSERVCADGEHATYCFDQSEARMASSVMAGTQYPMFAASKGPMPHVKNCRNKLKEGKKRKGSILGDGCVGGKGGGGGT